MMCVCVLLRACVQRRSLRCSVAGRTCICDVSCSRVEPVERGVVGDRVLIFFRKMHKTRTPRVSPGALLARARSSHPRAPSRGV